MHAYPFKLNWIIKLLLLVTCLSFIQVRADNSFSLEINEDIEIDILTIGEGSTRAIIWFACNQGDETAEVITARKLLNKGYQFYFPDMLSAHFLSPTPSNIARVPTQEISKVIVQILQTTKSEQVYLIGGARAAVPVLKGLSDDKVKNAGTRLKGALLITPRINSKTPEPGAEPVYISEAGQSTHPVLILEGERTPNRWGLPHLVNTLSKSGSVVKSGLIKGVRGFFYLRTEKTPEEDEMTSNLDQLIDTNIKKLETFKQ